jgi:hypothetical protein
MSTRALINAMEARDLERMSQALQTPTNLDYLRIRMPMDAPANGLEQDYNEDGEPSFWLDSAIDWAVHCQLPVAGFKLLLHAGAELDEKYEFPESDRLNFPHPGTPEYLSWPDIEQVMLLLSPIGQECFDMEEETPAATVIAKSSSRL